MKLFKQLDCYDQLAKLKSVSLQDDINSDGELFTIRMTFIYCFFALLISLSW